MSEAELIFTALAELSTRQIAETMEATGMKKLSDIPFPPILDTSSGDIIRDFFNPALAASLRYDRGHKGGING